MSLDSISREALAGRAVGQFPISIATSLAIESAVGIHEDFPSDTPPILKRGLLMVNVRTLIRNLWGSLEKDEKVKLNEYTMAEAISNEIRTIESVIAEYADGRCECIFFECTYGDLMGKFHRGLVKVPNTPGQMAYAAIERAVVKLLRTEFAATCTVVEYVRSFPDMHERAMIITHYPIDLLQRYRFDNLVLLESHTGAIKPPTQWNTKLHNGKELSMIPFDRMTLQLFGDGVIFQPMPIKIRQRVLEIATKHNWSAITTKDYVIKCVVENRDPALEMLVKDLYRK